MECLIVGRHAIFQLLPRILAVPFSVNEIRENKKPLYFVQLDALRFLAAFMIILVHAMDGWVGWFGIPKRLASADGKDWSWFGHFIHRLISNFPFGVDVFFLISGFLITFLLLKEKEEKGKINIPNFFLRRIFRIWPLYFFIVAIAPFLVHWMGAAKPDYLPVVLFYNNFHTISQEAHGLEPWLFPFSHFWSICIEEHFYLIWPFLVMLFPVRRLPVVLLSIIIASISFRAWAYYNLDGHAWFPLYMHTLSRIDALAIGGLAAWAHFHKPYSLQIPGPMRLLLFGILLWSLSVDNLSEFNSIFEVCWKKYIYLGLAGLLMMNYVFSPDAKLRFGPRHIFSYLGRCSYGIYMWGNILLPIIISKIILPYFPQPNIYVYWLIVLGISLAVPVITYELLEKPFLKLKSRFAVILTRI